MTRCAYPGLHEADDQLFDISRIRGLYPQFFVRLDDEMAYLGDFEAAEKLMMIVVTGESVTRREREIR